MVFFWSEKSAQLFQLQGTSLSGYLFFISSKTNIYNTRKSSRTGCPGTLGNPGIPHNQMRWADIHIWKLLPLPSPLSYWASLRAKFHSHDLLFEWEQRKHMVSLVAQTVKCLPAMWETLVLSLGREDPLEKEMATLSSTLAWKIPWTEDPGRLQSMGSQIVENNWSDLACTHPSLASCPLSAWTNIFLPTGVPYLYSWVDRRLLDFLPGIKEPRGHKETCL